jgi:hypothetical protein
MTENKNLSQVINDLEEFLQREGLSMDRQLLRSKLRYLHQNLNYGRQRSVVRGMLIRLNKLKLSELAIRVMDIIISITSRRGYQKSLRKIKLNRYITPKDIIPWLEKETYPLKLEYT